MRTELVMKPKGSLEVDSKGERISFGPPKRWDKGDKSLRPSLGVTAALHFTRGPQHEDTMCFLGGPPLYVTMGGKGGQGEQSLNWASCGKAEVAEGECGVAGDSGVEWPSGPPTPPRPNPLHFPMKRRDQSVWRRFRSRPPPTFRMQIPQTWGTGKGEANKATIDAWGSLPAGPLIGQKVGGAHQGKAGERKMGEARGWH